MKILVTGNAGFIGFHVAKALLERGDEVVGFDSVSDYYDPQLKEARLRVLEETNRRTNSGYHFVRANLAERAAVDACFAEHKFDRVIHLAAQAGVGYSFEGSPAHVESSNVVFTNCSGGMPSRRRRKLAYASTSIVYGANTSMPFLGAWVANATCIASQRRSSRDRTQETD